MWYRTVFSVYLCFCSVSLTRTSFFSFLVKKKCFFFFFMPLLCVTEGLFQIGLLDLRSISQWPLALSLALSLTVLPLASQQRPGTSAACPTGAWRPPTSSPGWRTCERTPDTTASRTWRGPSGPTSLLPASWATTPRILRSEEQMLELPLSTPPPPKKGQGCSVLFEKKLTKIYSDKYTDTSSSWCFVCRHRPSRHW